ncbi:conserved domain protein [Parvimonas sp. oral taxon 393 str. F0440]|nr:conserved domain protein [Parvimonas sp. oral taxon 393 str. F0440]
MRGLSRLIANSIANSIENSKYRDYIWFAFSIAVSLILIYTIYYNFTNGEMDTMKIVGVVLCSFILIIMLLGAFVFLKKIREK